MTLEAPPKGYPAYYHHAERSRSRQPGAVDPKAIFDPRNVAGLSLWYDVTQQYNDEADATAVAGLTDYSGNGNDASPTGSYVWDTDVKLNGHPNVYNATWANWSFTRISTVRFIAKVYQIHAFRNGSYQFFLGDSVSYHFHGNGVDFIDLTWASSNLSNANATWEVNGAGINPETSGWASHYNVSKIYTVATGGNVDVNQFTEDRTQNRENRGYFWELLIYSTLPSAAEQTSLLNYLNAKYQVY